MSPLRPPLLGPQGLEGARPDGPHTSEMACGDGLGRRAGEDLDRKRLFLGEDSEGAVEALMDLDAGPRIRAPSGIRQDLHVMGPEAHRVVILDGAQVLKAADGGEVEAGGQGPEGRRSFSRGPSEAAIVARDVGGEEGVRPGEVGDAGEAEFTDQPILEGAADPLDAAFGLGGGGGDPLDAQLGEGTANLGGRGRAAQLLLERERRARRPLEDPVPIGVDGDGDPMGRDELAEEEQIAGGIFALTEDRPEDGAGGIIDGVEQDERGAAVLEPRVVAAVHLDEQTGAPHALPALSVLRRATALGAAQPRGPKDAMHGGVGQDDVVPLGEELSEMLVIDVGVDGAGEPNHTRADGGTDTQRRRAAAIPMDQSLSAAASVRLPDPPEVADGEPDEGSGLGHHHLAPLQGVENDEALLRTLCQRDHASPLRMAGGRTFSLKS